MSFLVSLSDELIETSPFFAMISSLTRFISTSSFSISTRTVLPTAGFAAFFAVAVVFLFFAGAASAFVAAFAALFSLLFAAFAAFSSSSFFSFSSCAACFADSSSFISNGPTTAFFTSETFSMAALTVSRLSFVK